MVIGGTASPTNACTKLNEFHRTTLKKNRSTPFALIKRLEGSWSMEDVITNIKVDKAGGD